MEEEKIEYVIIFLCESGLGYIRIYNTSRKKTLVFENVLEYEIDISRMVLNPISLDV